MRFKKLTDKEVQSILSTLEKMSNDPENWDKFYKKYSQIKARLEFPLGELLNKNITGYVWAWKATKKISTAPIDPKDKFNAQGLEGKAIIYPVDLITALLAYRELPKHRRVIYVVR